MSPEHVAITVPHLTYADLHGIDSHGCGMLLHYQRLLAAGVLTMTPVVSVVREDEATALVDGGGGLGHVPGDLAMRLAIAKCRARGVGAVAVRNSGHFGAAGAYAAMGPDAGLIGLATTTTQEPAVVPTFGATAMLGTNPIALAAPAARNPPFVLDMATSTASLGKLTTAWRKGRALPGGWALDPSGSAVTSARRATRYRRLTPLGATPELGSHKGYGLATAVAILSSVLPGALLEPGGAGAASRVGHFFLALDPARFRDAGTFGADLDLLLDGLRACTPADAARPVLVAGDPEHAARRERLRSGVPLTRSLLEDLRTVARHAGVPFSLDE
jgi:LDH2 family malate/lactate/ureidoglycolate dehydrogenase